MCTSLVSQGGAGASSVEKRRAESLRGHVISGSWVSLRGPLDLFDTTYTAGSGRRRLPYVAQLPLGCGNEGCTNSLALPKSAKVPMEFAKFQRRMRWPKWGATRPNSAAWPPLVKFCRIRARCAQSWGNFDQYRPMGPELTKFGSDFAEFRPNLRPTAAPHVRPPSSTKLGQRLPGISQSWSGIGQTRPECGQLCPEPAQIWLETGRIRPEVCLISTKRDRNSIVHPMSAKLGPESFKIRPEMAQFGPNPAKSGPNAANFKPAVEAER